MPQPPVFFPGLFAIRDDLISELGAVKAILVEELAAVRRDISKISVDKCRCADSPAPRSSGGRYPRISTASVLAHVSTRRGSNTSSADYARHIKIEEPPTEEGGNCTPVSPYFSMSSNYGGAERLSPQNKDKFHDLRIKAAPVANKERRLARTETAGTMSDYGMFRNLGCIHNVEDIKLRVLETKMATVKGVTDYYHKTGYAQKIARSHLFEHVTLLVIVVSALWMGIDTDLNDADSIIEADAPFVIADILFFSYFALEIIIRFLAFKRKVDCLRSAWFLFDSALVTVYFFDPFVLGLIDTFSGSHKATSFLRLLRLVRLTRLTRLLRTFPELMIMVKGMVTAMATVGYTLGLLGLVTYVFAIAIRNLVPEDSHKGSIETDYFVNVPETMHHLLLYGTLLDTLSEFIIKIKEASVPVLFLAWIYIALSAMLIMNMLIGILCEVISAVATEEKEIMMVERVKKKFTELLHKYDENNTGSLTWDEFALLLEDETTQTALKKVDVSLECLVDLAEDMFFYSGEDVDISYKQFIQLLLDLRGSQLATVKDVMAIGKRVNCKCLELRNMLEVIAVQVSAF